MNLSATDKFILGFLVGAITILAGNVLFYFGEAHAASLYGAVQTAFDDLIDSQN